MLPIKPLSMPKGEYSVIEEWVNSLSHAFGFVLSIVGLVALIIKSQGITETVVVTIYGASLAFMFLSSAIYHAVKHSQYRAVLRKIDHTAIYLLIAGSYTPFLVFTVDGRLSVIGLAVIWAVGLAGIGFKLIAGHKYPKISIISYAVMGWLALFLIYPIYQSLSAVGFILLLVGGLCYSAGIPLYLLKSRHYSHALWHLAVLAGAACHFFAVYYHVM